MRSPKGKDRGLGAVRGQERTGGRERQGPKGPTGDP